MSKSETARKKRSWIKYVLILFFGGGGGAGGVLFKDHPVLQRLFNAATHRAPDAGPVTGKEALAAVVQAVAEVKDGDAYKKGGDFELTFSSLSLDPGQFKHGQTLDLRIKLIKIGTDDTETTAWDSRDKEEDGHPVVVGTRIQTTWSDLKVPISWAPGEAMAIEVWDRKPLRNRMLFTWTGEGKDGFPLRSGTYTLAKNERGRLIDQPGCEFTVEARPKQGRGEAAASIAREAVDAIRNR